jgi:light-regulated signal transduction histidine kinase (bacteriophytochrome)
MRLGAVSMKELVAEVVRDLEPDTETRTVEWIVGGLPDVRGDSALVRQVWVNLLSNAVKYSCEENPARIEIGCERSAEGEQRFFVRDNGVGFDMKYVDRLFGVFQRLHSEEQFEGTGIGLANVRRIVHRHGGRTWAESTLGEGSTFWFSMPLSETSSSGKESV